MLRVCSWELQGLTLPLLPHVSLASKAIAGTLLSEQTHAQPNGLWNHLFSVGWSINNCFKCLVMYVLFTDYLWDWLKIPEKNWCKNKLVTNVCKYIFRGFDIHWGGEPVFSHWYESISHQEKAEAHKGKLFFYLYLGKAKTIYQNIIFTSKFSLGLVLKIVLFHYL